ncbi:MAG: hypothetical protein JOZ69_22850 [Myxococcales bacterium]|nr:hypothetical protein [Myxococcales bacterium]
MRAGVWNLVFGLAAVAAGASGQFALPFTGSPTALMIVGGVVAALGIFQLIRARRS